MGKVREGNEVSMAAHMPMHDMNRGSCVHHREDRITRAEGAVRHFQLQGAATSDARTAQEEE
jgi:hypothetical protein